ncbi:MAG: GGDEF domain-containing protein [Treponema sp.]|nr:GGDEF domain-containing protein [Treponema sp.]
MDERNINFIQYKENLYKSWQRNLLIIDATLALAVLIIECLTYITLLGSNERAELRINYILLRIVTPTALDFFSLLLAIIFCKSKKPTSETKNMMVSVCFFIICSVLSIFHNYFHILLISHAIAFFVCTIFGDTKILKRLALLSLFFYPVSVLAFWFDPDTGSTIYKTLTIICATCFGFFSYIYSNALVISRSKQLAYIHQSYQTQTELIEELKIEPLTRLYNRVALDGAIKRVICNQKENNTTPFLVMLDLDYFKKINDKYGHTAGDKVLIRLSDVIKENMGGPRQAFRYGGEEFVLLFEDSMQAPVLHLVDNIRSSFENERFDFAPELSCTLSAGIAEYRDDYNDKSWLDVADKAMYYSKEHGRNQIHIYEQV